MPTRALHHHRTGRSVYKYASSQSLTFPLGPGISVAMGREPIWLNASLMVARTACMLGEGTAGLAVDSAPTCLGPPWALQPFKLLKDQVEVAGPGRSAKHTVFFAALALTPSMPHVSLGPSQPCLLQASLHVPGAVVLKPSSDLGAPVAHQFPSPSQNQV